jgi:hypothetical protein
MTSFQQQLIEKLAAKKIEATFSGDFLNCRVAITNRESGKIKWQKFSFVFDDAADCQGARLVGKMSGAYSEHFAKDAFAIIVAHSTEVAALEI